MSQSLFYWITYSYEEKVFGLNTPTFESLNPYFIGLPILIIYFTITVCKKIISSQSLFYWITYSYNALFISE